MDKKTLIDKYIISELNKEEQVQFDQWMKEDEKFRNDVQFYSNLSVVAESHEKDVLSARLTKVEDKMGNKKKSLIRRVLLIVLGVLLLVAAFVGYRLDKMKNTPSGIYATHFEVYPNVYYPTTRGNGDLMTKAFMAYENGDYVAAADLLEERIKTSEAIELKFYQAMAYAGMGNLPLAIKNLENIRRFQSAYYDECLWYLGLFYLKLGNAPAAIDRFQTFYEVSDDAAKKKVAADAIRMLNAN
ncbi:tetratricopeptide repeat protein [Portibacter lacus]|uniref:Tetratricopeptide repeat protein n=1 Tax=Portibacter lacus TaxID=1099794 RepID=A0AA37SY09_9BACT|nr:hypothetical protein [Portibacter lacus]GLR19713.1 hypothetical protein GCM10007940_43290 [Portibacter lacus]